MAAPVWRVDLRLGGSWTNVSAYLDVTHTVRFRRGRAKSFAPSSTGTASFTLNNNDGRFTPGNTSGAYSPNIVRRVGVRLYLDGSRVWTGYVDRWSVRLEGKQAFSDVECVDLLKSVSSTVLHSMAIEETALLANANGGACWPLSDQNITTGDQWAAWRNTSASPMTIKGGLLAGKPGSFDFQQDAPKFMKGSCQLTQDDTGFYGPVLQSPLTFDPGSGGAVMFWFKTSNVDTVLMRMDRQGSNTANMTIAIGSSGGLVFSSINDSGDSQSLSRSTSAATGVAFNDNTWHFVCAGTSVAGTQLRWYIDGSGYVTGTGLPARTIAATNRRLTVGGWWGFVGDTPAMTMAGNIAGVAVIPGWATSTTALGLIWNAGINGRSGQSIADHISALHGYLGSPFGTITLTDATSGYTVGGQDTAGKDLGACIDEIGHAEGGVLYADHLNALQYVGYDAWASTSGATPTIDGDLTGDLLYEADDDGYFNALDVTGTTGGSVYREDSTAITADGLVGETRTGVVAGSLSLLGDYADRELARATDTNPALRQITLDLLTGDTAAAARIAYCQMALTTYFGVTNLPTAVLGTGTATGHVCGYEVEGNTQWLTMKVDLG